MVSQHVSVLAAIALCICRPTTAFKIRQATGKSVALVDALPFYHSGVQLSEEVRILQTSCEGARLSVEKRSERGVSMDLLTVKGLEGTTKGVNNRMFIASGEHARELIGSETTLHFLRMLCGQIPMYHGSQAKDVLAHTEFAVVLNSNPLSREKVDAGEYCWRANPNNVDLNRNWDEHWEAVALRSDTGGPGAKPFSEPESSLLKALISEFRPTAYVSVHSGTFGMYMPWAYSTTADLAHDNQASMLEVLRKLDADYCTCPFGAAGKEVGYSCPGTSVDWVYDKLNTSFSFAFEIYVSGNREAYTKRWKATTASPLALIQVRGGRRATPNDLGHPAYADFFKKHPSDFVGLQTHAAHTQQEDPDWCLSYYNPQTEEAYNKTVGDWAMALLDMSSLVSKKISGVSQRSLSGLLSRLR